MSTFDVLRRFGTVSLLRFAALVVLFCCLHLARLPFLAIGWLLEAAMRRVDAAVTARVAGMDTRTGYRGSPRYRRADATI